jgi:hypothetical protein
MLTYKIIYWEFSAICYLQQSTSIYKRFAGGFPIARCCQKMQVLLTMSFTENSWTGWETYHLNKNQSLHYQSINFFLLET